MKVQSDSRVSYKPNHMDAERHEPRGTVMSNQARAFGTPIDRGALAAQQTIDVLRQYAREPGTTLHADPRWAGVYRDETGSAYIPANDRTYPVRYDRDNGTWRVYRPDAPTKPQYPVRMDELGNWALHREVGLKGGAPRITQELRSKINALLLDGWSMKAVATRLHVPPYVVHTIRSEAVVTPNVPLASYEFRNNVVARLEAGAPVEQVAHDTGVHPETVLLIQEAWTAANKPEADAAQPGENQAAPIARPASFALKAPTTRMHEALQRKVARFKIHAGIIAKADRLRRDGWSIPAVEIELSLPGDWRHHMKMPTVDAASSRLGSEQFRHDVFARLARGMSDRLIANELGAQPETIRVLRDVRSAHNLVSATRTRSTSDAIAVASTTTSASTASRRPASPQAGTSTGGWTYPSTVRRDPAFVRAGTSTADVVHAGGTEPGTSWAPPPKRLRTDSATPGVSQAAELAIIDLLEAGVDSERIAKELGVPELVVLDVAIARLNRLIEINDTRSGTERRVEQTDPAREAPLPELNTREFQDRLLDEEFADLDMEPFKALLASSPEGRLHERESN